MPLYLKNPHSILAVLEIRPQDIFEIRLPTAHAGDTWEAVRTAAQEIGIKIAAPETGGRNPRRNPRDKRRSPGRIGVAEAVVKDHPGVALEALFSGIKASEPGLWIALDTVQDPQNLGAIFRAAAFFNVRGIVLTRARSAPLNGTAYDVASGGVEYVPFSVQTNLSRTLDLAKDRGLWVLGASEHADTDLSQVQPDRPWLLVLGNEETGIRRLTRDKCDVHCRIPVRGHITSLNVSVAAGILIHHLSR